MLRRHASVGDGRKSHFMAHETGHFSSIVDSEIASKSVTNMHELEIASWQERVSASSLPAPCRGRKAAGGMQPRKLKWLTVINEGYPLIDNG